MAPRASSAAGHSAISSDTPSSTERRHPNVVNRTSTSTRPSARVLRLDHLVDDPQPFGEWREGALHRVDREPLEVVDAPTEGVGELLELRGHRRRAHQPVVGVDRDTEAQAAEHADRVLGDRLAHAGAEVRRRAQLERDAPVAHERRQPTELLVAGRPLMSSTMRTPWPSRSAPQNCTASQMLGRPNASPAWMVVWKFSLRTYSKASRCRVGGNPSSAPAMSKPTTPASRQRTASSAISRLRAAVRMAEQMR